MLDAAERVRIGGPYFEDFAVGDVFDDAPALTITSGHAALHQALTGDRLRLPLDAELSRAVTGRDATLAHPSLVCDIAIGQSTGPTQRVRGNLFYRGLVLQHQVFVGDTLTSRTEIVALKQNKPRGGTATGLVVLRIRTVNQHGEGVLDFWRCPMIPLRDAAAQTGHADSFGDIPQELDPAELAAAIPADWNLECMRERVSGPTFADLKAGTVWEIEGRDTVTAAPELVRLTLNVASVHVDAGAGAHGRRLVYGGHTISMAAAQVARALPNLLTVLAWRGCDHLAPVFEGDILSTELTLEGKQPAADGGLVELRALVAAHREDSDEPVPVLDWRFVGLMA